MEPDFWHARWQDNRIAFHEGEPNALLVAHFSALGVPAGGRILVPLCGKSHDMHWLCGQGCRVVGVELSRLAVEQFFDERGVTPAISAVGRLERFEAGCVTLFVGDIFDLDRETLGSVDAVYDRAALVALPAPLRERYAAHLIALTATARQLLVTFEYDQARQAGPPFSVWAAEVHELYSAAYRLDCIEAREVPGGLKGLCPAQESVWSLQPR